MQFIDLKEQYQKIKETVDQRILNVLAHNRYILGPEVKEFEQKLADYLNVKHCIPTSNGSDALLIALMALDIGPGDEVITTPFTFAATIEAILLLKATPVLVDIDPLTYNIDPHLIEAAITQKTKVILPVNLYGQCANYEVINAIAEKHRLFVIEDAAQSLGARHHGKKSGNWGHIACTSFFPSKPLGCYGDGGACFTNDDRLAEIIKQIANHGQSTRYEHVRLGINGRLDSIQAAVLLSKLEIFDQELKKRTKIAEYYSQALTSEIKTPYTETFNTHVFAQYTIASSQREAIKQHLNEKSIPFAIHYPIPVHKQPAFRHLANGSLTNAEIAAEQVLSLPFHPYLKENDIELITQTVNHAIKTSVHS